MTRTSLFRLLLPLTLALVLLIGGAAIAHAAVEPPGSVSGVLTEASTGLPAQDVEVAVCSWNNVWSEWAAVAQTRTDYGTGAYTISNVPPGTYKLRILDPYQRYAPKFYPSALKGDDGQDVVVVSGSDTPVDTTVDPAGLITGTVTNSVTGLPAADIVVTAFPPQGAVGYPTTTRTDSDGRYTVGGLGTGLYKLAFEVSGGAGLYEPQYYDDVLYYNGKTSTENWAAATAVAVIAGSSTTADESLLPAGKLAGTITDAETGFTIAGAMYQGKWDMRTGGTTYYSWANASGNTNASGFYSINGYGGRWQLYVTSYGYSGRYEYYTVSPDATTTANVQLLASRVKVRGTITGPESQALEGVTATLYWQTVEGWSVKASTQTLANGTYEFTDIPFSAKYKVYFSDGSGSWLAEYYDDASTLNSAKAISISPYGEFVADAQLAAVPIENTAPAAQGQTISTPDGMPVAAELAATDAQNDPVTYRIVGNPTNGGVTLGGSVATYTPDAGFTGIDTFQIVANDGQLDSTPVTIRVLVRLTGNGSVSGTVVESATGLPAEDVQVSVCTWDSTWSQWSPVASTRTSYGSGDYTVSNLPPGVYKVRVEDPYQRYAPKYYPNATMGNEADDVEVLPGWNTSVNMKVASGGRITGTLTDSLTGVPAQDVVVTAMPPLGALGYPTSTRTDSEGHYTIGGLGTAAYRLSFEVSGGSGRYEPQYYSGVLATAKPWSEIEAESRLVDVVEGADSVADDTLVPAGRVYGTVTDAETGFTLPSTMFEASWDLRQGGTYYKWTNGNSNASGDYEFYGFGGKWRVDFAMYGYGFHQELISVSPGAEVPLNVQLKAARATIRGTVTDTSASAIEGIDVVLHWKRVDGWGVKETTSTAADGTYSFSDIPFSTDYKLEFRDDAGSWTSEFYSDAASLAAAAPIRLTPNGEYVANAELEQVNTAHPPVITGVSTALAPVVVNTSVSVAACFTDPAPEDTHIASVTWDDGVSGSAAVTESGGAGTATASRTFSTPGVYSATVRVTDTANDYDEETSAFVVVYDPSGGFVTGGGWLNSPKGSFASQPELAGTASFGFVSRYVKNSSFPVGNTAFAFDVGGLSFESSGYEWLVISGPKAQYKGVGTVNGSPGYGFMLTAWDGQATGGGGIDKLRMKIWDTSSGAIVYDNQLGASDSSTPSTALGGGSIVVHKK